MNEQQPDAMDPQNTTRLFDVADLDEGVEPVSMSAGGGTPRFNRPQRRQIEMRSLSLDQMLAEDHRARVVWQYVESLDLSALYDKIRAREGHVGRNPVDPRILMAVWMLATVEGIGSARRLAELCTRDMPYMWLCGGVGVNHHLLSDFRTAHPEVLDQLLTDTIATLLHQELVTLDRVAQDGMRVRASAGKSSFRRRKTLEEFRDDARQQIERLREENESDPSSGDRRVRAARERAACERQQRVNQALAELDKLTAQKERRAKGSGEDARSSTTDPEARNMKMSDGGFRPAYNVQFATACGSRIIVGVNVTNQGTDGGQMGPMFDQLHERYGHTVGEYLADGSFVSVDDITRMEQEGTHVYVPIKDAERQVANGKDPYARQRADTSQTFQWRQRMQTDAARKMYRERCSTAEFPNAGCRNRGLHQFLVRGLAKVRAVTLWHALAHNFQRICSPGWGDAPAIG